MANLKFEEKSQNEDVECLKNRKQNLDLACLNRRQVALTDFYELQEEISILSKEQDDKKINEKICQIRRKQAEAIKKCHKDCLPHQQSINSSKTEIIILESQIKDIQDEQTRLKSDKNFTFDDAIKAINGNIDLATVDDFHKASLKSFFYELLELASRLKI